MSEQEKIDALVKALAITQGHLEATTIDRDRWRRQYTELVDRLIVKGIDTNALFSDEATCNE